MSAHVLLILLNKLGKRDKNARLAEHFISFLGLPSILSHFRDEFNSIKQKHEC